MKQMSRSHPAILVILASALTLGAATATQAEAKIPTTATRRTFKRPRIASSLRSAPMAYSVA